MQDTITQVDGAYGENVRLEWLQTDWSPTKMVPPMAARALGRVK
jgi:hypothetical protein